MDPHDHLLNDSQRRAGTFIQNVHHQAIRLWSCS